MRAGIDGGKLLHGKTAEPMNIQIGAEEGHVIVKFPYDIRYLAMKADEACILAENIVKAANRLGTPILLVPKR